jgi:hypothetical protein
MGHEKPPEWHRRETDRFASGEYKPVVWCTEGFWDLHHSVHRHHFAHQSTDDATKLAYTPDDRHGQEDRQIRTRPGKYLKRFFGDVLTDEQIRDYATDWAAKTESLDYKLATTPDDCATVYASSLGSCMSLNGHDEWTRISRLHILARLATPRHAR